MFLNKVIDPLAQLIGEWITELNIGTILIRLVLAVLCAGVIGVERAKKRHAAGFRTYILVCLGAAIAMLTNQFIFETYGTGDASRFGAQVISGIGFLGAGTILVTSRSQIKGLTTAAGLWASACIGLTIGVGFYTLALIGTLIIIACLSLFPYIEKWLTKRANMIELHIELDERASLKELVNFVRKQGMRIILVENNTAYARSGLSVYTISLDTSKLDNDNVIDILRSLEYVNYVEKIK